MWALMFLRWVEQDPKEILQSVYECVERTCEKLNQLNIDISNIKGIFNSIIIMNILPNQEEKVIYITYRDEWRINVILLKYL